MINIAFCDDDLTILDQLREIVTRYSGSGEWDVRVSAFQSSLDLMATIEKGIRYDVLFLDIMMPGQNGIATAKEIRKFDDNVKIIFLTSTPEYAVQSYMVGAYYYQLKPIQEKAFVELLDSVLDACERESSKSLILRCKNGITRVELQRLEYCEVMHRTVFIHLNNGMVLESVGTMDELYREIASLGGFVRPHRSYLVNLEYISNITYRGIKMNCGAEIPIPRGKYHELKDLFLEYAFRNGQVVL